MISSRPGDHPSAVVLPHPDGPTSTMNSPPRPRGRGAIRTLTKEPAEQVRIATRALGDASPRSSDSARIAAAMGELRRVLKPGGTLFVTVPFGRTRRPRVAARLRRGRRGRTGRGLRSGAQRREFFTTRPTDGSARAPKRPPARSTGTTSPTRRPRLTAPLPRARSRRSTARARCRRALPPAAAPGARTREARRSSGSTTSPPGTSSSTSGPIASAALGAAGSITAWRTCWLIVASGLHSASRASVSFCSATSSIG